MFGLFEKAHVREDFHTVPDGLRIHYNDFAAHGGTAKTPVLCLHGLTRNNRDFEDLAPRIAKLGRRVVAPSMRGRGRSDYDSQPLRYTPATYVGDMISLMDALSIEKAIVVGTSMGGLMAMVMAAAHPGRLAGVVLNDVGPELEPTGLARIGGYVGGAKPFASWGDAAAYAREINGSAYPDESGDRFWAAFARRIATQRDSGEVVLDYDPGIAAPFAETAAPVDMWPLFDALKEVPTLAVRGAISDLFSAATLATMARRKPDLLVVEAPNIGHAPFMTEPRVWRSVRAFLEQID